MEKTRRLYAAAAAALTPRPWMGLADWSDSNRRMPSDAARPGPWKTSFVPAALAVYEAVEGGCSTIILRASTQTLKSELLINAAFWFADLFGGQILFLEPNRDLARAFSEERFRPAAALMPRFAPWFAPMHARLVKTESGEASNIFNRPFPGGRLTLASVEQRDALISRSVRFVLVDEINKFARDPMGQLRSRQTAFSDSKMIVVSSPSGPEVCRITPLFEQGDRNYWHIVCPACKKPHRPNFDNLRWDAGQPDGAEYVCPVCGVLHDDKAMRAANRMGFFVAEAERKDIASFHIDAFGNPFLTLADLAAEYEAAAEHRARTGEDEQMRDFYQDRLCRIWEADDVLIQESEIREAMTIDYPKDGTLPAAINIIIATVDVQKNRLEYEICGFGHQIRRAATGAKYIAPIRYGIEKGKIMGNPSQRPTWDRLAQQVTGHLNVKPRSFKREDGLESRVHLSFVDTGGLHGQEVREFCANVFPGHPDNKTDAWVIPIKGSSVPGDVIARVSENQKTLDRYQNQFVIVGTDHAKDSFFGILRAGIKNKGRGKKQDRRGLLWPRERGGAVKRGYDAAYYAGLVSERPERKIDRRGREVTVWHAIKGRRNEPLDLAVYSIAAITWLGYHVLPAAAENIKALLAEQDEGDRK